MYFTKQGSSGCTVYVYPRFAVKEGDRDWLLQEIRAYQQLKTNLGSDFPELYPDFTYFPELAGNLLFLERIGAITLEEAFLEWAKQPPEQMNDNLGQKLIGLAESVLARIWLLAEKRVEYSSENARLFLKELQVLLDFSRTRCPDVESPIVPVLDLHDNNERFSNFTCSPCHRDLGFNNVVVADDFSTFKLIDPRLSVSRNVRSTGCQGTAGWDLVCLVVNMIRIQEIICRYNRERPLQSLIQDTKERLMASHLFSPQSILFFFIVRAAQLFACDCDFCRSHPYLAKVMEKELGWTVSQLSQLSKGGDDI